MKKFIILLLFFVTGCGVNCIEGSKGISGNSVVVEVSPTVKKVSKVLQPNWIDTELRVSKDQPPMRVAVTGALNMCPKDFLNPKNLIVPAVSCISDIKDISYKDESTYQNIKDVCSNASLRTKAANSEYLSGVAHTVSAFRLNKGDAFKVSLIPRKVKVTDCSSAALKELGVIYYSDDEIFEDSNCQQAIPAENICQNGVPKFYVKVNQECKESGGMAGAIPRLQGTEVSALVDNTDTPYGNKIFYSEDAKKNWINAPFVYDARIIKNQKVNVETLKKHCTIIKELNEKKIINHVDTISTSQFEYYQKQKAQGAIKGDITTDIIKELIDVINNFTTYDINCVCGTICNSKSKLVTGKEIATISNYGSDGNCIISGSYEYNKDATFEEISKAKLEDISKNANNSDPIIQGLTAFFGTRVTHKQEKDARNYYCFPQKVHGGSCYADISSQNIDSNSLKSNISYAYDSDESVTLRFAVIGEKQKYASYSGGYNIHVERICNFMYGKKLYMYIGDNPPTIFPGDPGTIELFVPDPENPESGTGVYMINKDGSEKKSGKVYLGIDVRGYENQFDYSSLPGIESANKYFVDFFIKRWNPNFSKVFVMIRDFLLRILYGVPKDTQVDNIAQALDVARTSKSQGAIQSIYANQTGAGSLWRALQALCSLYIVFTVLGYAIGVVKFTKYDLGVRIAKIAIVVGLISQGSWEFFSDHFFSIFIQGTSDLVAAFNGELDGDNSFRFLDTTLGILLTGEVWIRLLTLILTGPIGWLIFYIIFWAFFVFFMCVIEAIIAYLLTIVAVAFLATLAPIFITFIFFQLTKTLFDAWVKMLVNFSLQPIILFAALAFLNQVVLTVLYKVTSFTVCNQCYLGFDLPTSAVEEGAPYDICLVSVLLPVGYSPDLSITESIRESYVQGNGGLLGLPFDIASALILLLAAHAMRGFKGMSETIAHSISGSVAGLSASVYGATQALASIVGRDQETQNIIKEAMRNRKSTGKSDVDIVSRSNPNPESRGESVERSGGSDSDLPPKGHDGGLRTGISDKGDNVPQQPQSGDDIKEDSKTGRASEQLHNDVSPLSSSSVLDTTPFTLSYNEMQGADNLDSNPSVTRNDTSADGTSGMDSQDASSDAGSELHGDGNTGNVATTQDTGDNEGDGAQNGSRDNGENAGNASNVTEQDTSSGENDEVQGGSRDNSESADDASSITEQDSSSGESDEAQGGSRDNDENADDTSSVAEDTSSDESDEAQGGSRDNDENGDSTLSVAEQDTSSDESDEAQGGSRDNDENADDTSSVAEQDTSSDESDEAQGGSRDNDENADDTSSVAEQDTSSDESDEAQGGSRDNDENDDSASSVTEQDADSVSDGTEVSTSDGDNNLGNDQSTDNTLDGNENTSGNNDTDVQEEAGKASSVVESSDSDDSDGRKRGRKDINFLDGPQRKRLYMDEYSSVAEKIAGHESAIAVEEESYERGIVKKRGKKDQQE
ncbi:type IV secretion system protein [Ehrlichia chaffeensis]|uniref:type IV secretion system protein n=1 Tax=Ehrlichia chaffeensis TaxID=945 RepID=UPI000444EC4E|nr:type IV secretion system protein [Ehrlichia chaffeensis]AHX10008.1 trbL/VirB6 plasmid conjugal transfer family protein [Ehrlichia chaffeensis str. Wakulla]